MPFPQSSNAHQLSLELFDQLNLPQPQRGPGFASVLTGIAASVSSHTILPVVQRMPAGLFTDLG